MSTAANPADPHSAFFDTAEVRVVSQWPRPRSGYKSAYVLVSSRIYWKEANKDASNKPQSFLDFQNADSVELFRLEDGTWDDVDGHVKVVSHNGRRRIVVCGRPHGRTRLHAPLRGGNVQVEILPNAPEELERWINHLRGQIAPWKLLQQEVKEVTNRAPSCGVEEIEKALGGIVTSTMRTELSSFSTDNLEWKRTNNLGTLPEQTEKLSIVDELIAHGTAAVETCAALSRLVAKHLAETAEVVGDVAKCVTGLSTIFHLVALGAQGVSLCAEASRGRRVLLVLLGQIVVLLQYTLESMSEIMKSSRSVNQVDIDFVFNVFKQAIGAIHLAETQLLRGRGSQIINAGDVKELEGKVEELKQMAVIAGNTSKICAVVEKVNKLDEERKIGNDYLHHVRPSLSAFFSGRGRELGTLREILEKHGSAVITQYGGMGKTELMIALADRAERDGVVPGGVFWVTVDGGERNVIGSLAKLAEKLNSRKMDEEERRNPNLVVAALKQGLDRRKGRWLLCLDNADDSKVSGILNEVCGLAGGGRENGWVAVTSRQGQPYIWNRMKSEQKLVLEPLCVKDAMVALWRQIRKIETDVADDDEVMNTIKDLEKDYMDEYRALEELCGDEGSCSLGGLPLALVQAGTYMARFECSFVEYLNMFENAKRMEEMKQLMRNTEEVKAIIESQRSIWTTWKISVEKLSPKGYAVLRAMAMLGHGGVEEAIVMGIVKGFAAEGSESVRGTFQEVVIEELVQGSSLICRKEREREGKEGYTYRMHRLVWRFIMNDIERGSALWNEVYSAALVTIHEAVATELEKEGKSFETLPDVFGNNHDEFVAHATALVTHHTLPVQDAKIRNVLEVEDIHRYCGEAMGFMGKTEEEVHVWKCLVDILNHLEVANRRGSSSVRSTDVQYSEYQGKELKSRIADVYNSLGIALLTNGDLNDAASKHEESLELYRAIHGHEKPHPDIATSLGNLGRVYKRQGKLNKALEMHEQSFEMKLAIHGHGKPHLTIATSLDNLGRVYKALGRLNEALEKHEQSLEMKLAIHGHDKPHPTIATSFDNLGRVYKALGRLDEALEKHNQSLEMELEIHGHDKLHPDIATSLSNIGRVYEGLGKLDESLEKHVQSMAMKLAIYGHDKPHPAIATSLSNLGRVYARLGKLDKALEKYEQSMEMYLAIHGNNKHHPAVAMSLRNLANVYSRLDKLDKSLEKQKQSLEAYLAIHGHDEPHLSFASSLNNLGLLYQKLGKLDEALENHEQSMKMYLAIYGHDTPHPAIAASFNNLGNVYQRLGKLDKALEKHKQSLEMELAIHGHEKPHSAIATSLSNLGNVYRRLGKLDKALENHEQCLKMELMIHGRGKPHPTIARSLSNLGSVYEGLGKLDKALEKHEQSLEMYLEIHGNGKPHPDIATSLSNVGNVYEELSRLDKALEKHEQSLQMYLHIHGNDKPHPAIATSLSNLGNVYEGLGKLDEALEKHEQSLKMYLAIHGDDKPHPTIATSLSNVGSIYEGLGKLGKALEKHKKSLEMEFEIHGHDKPHHDIAISQWNIGAVYHKQQMLDQAARFLEQSLEMLRILHAGNSQQPDIKDLLCDLADVYRDQRKQG